MFNGKYQVITMVNICVTSIYIVQPDIWEDTCVALPYVSLEQSFELYNCLYKLLPCTITLIRKYE